MIERLNTEDINDKTIDRICEISIEDGKKITEILMGVFNIKISKKRFSNKISTKITKMKELYHLRETNLKNKQVIGYHNI